MIHKSPVLGTAAVLLALATAPASAADEPATATGRQSTTQAAGNQVMWSSKQLQPQQVMWSGQLAQPQQVMW
ncbi:hypothetical protein QF035_004500 [Streptomyces umbrinus]|uniref:Uncharacterized protein n=1 Tax=Streptomyces umbrinus TaxID=67370 RepID=A0ABU0STT3_9ACTN|nr:hypothetical protein [Streptomyces umbrinus]MDQ1026918.1 hypothetical protein [Streptomyces umbrinus]